MKSKNVNEFINQSLLLPKLLGMFPMTNLYRLSVGALLRTVLTCGILCVLAKKTFSFLFILAYRWMLTKYLDFLELFILLGAILLCFLLTLNGTRHLSKVVDSLEDVEYILSRFNSGVTYNCLYSAYHESARILLSLAAIAEQFILPLEASSWWDNLIYLLTVHLAYLILHLFLAPFYVLLYAFIKHVIALRQILDRVKINSGDWRRKTELVVHLNIQLYHSCCTLSSVYSTVAFIIVSVAFVVIVKNIYFVCYVMIEYGNIPRKMFYHLGVCFTFVIQWLLELYTIAYSCTKLASESSCFNDEVYELLLKDRTNLLQTNGKLKLHLAYKPVPFIQACGFFPLNFTLVQRIAGTATKYIVLLMQLGSGSGF